MPTVFTANESSVLVDGNPVEGVQSIDYRMRRSRANVYGLGSGERIAVASGPHDVEGRVRVASAAQAFDGLTADQTFQVIANLRRGETALTVTFDECLVTEKTFELAAGGHGEAVYSFSAARVREEA